MLQKVLIGTCAALVAACILFGVLLWQTVAEMRETNAALLTRAQEANATLLEQSRQANAAVLAELKSLKKSAATIDPEWNPVVIRLVKGTQSGLPASGFEVTLRSISNEGGSYHGATGSDGIADCGLMRPATYNLTVTSPWKETLSRNFQVRPGRAVEMTIVCPIKPPESIPVEWNIDWPSNLDELVTREETWLLALIDGKVDRLFGTDKWTLPGGERLLAFHPDGRTINLSTIDVSDLSADLVRRSSTIRQFLSERESDNPLVDQGRVWVGGRYQVNEVGLAQWDGTGSPLQLLFQHGMPAIDYGSRLPTGYSGGTIADVLEIGRPQPMYLAPARGRPVWKIAVPQGLVTWGQMWAKEVAEAKKRGGVPGRIHESLLYPLFPPEGDPIPFDEREPVEASRPYKTATTNAEIWPAVPLAVECLSDGEATPLAGVQLQLSRSDDIGPGPYVRSTSQTSDAHGIADFGQVPPGRYNMYSILPWQEWSQVHDLNAYGPDAVRFTLHCPDAPPPETTVEFDLTWPEVAKRQDELWLVLELAGYQTRTLQGQEWRSSDWHLVAIHPGGRTIVWSRNPDQRYFTLYPLGDLPREATARLKGLADFTTVGGLAEGGPHRFLIDGRYRVVGVGIARWNGQGQPSELWKGLHDGRYTSNGHGAFLYAFREQVPMKADETLPTLGLVSHNGQPATISYTVPEPLVSAALRRWENVPTVAQGLHRR